MERDYTWIRGVRDATLEPELIDPPPWVRQRAYEVFQPDGGRSLVERVRAALIFDSRSTMAHANARSATLLEGPWQLLYRGGDVDIDLLVRPNQDGRTTMIRGQALPLSGAIVHAGSVVAIPADAVTPCLARVELEPGGEFAFSDLRRGRYDVLVRFGAREIELSGVEL